MELETHEIKTKTSLVPIMMMMTTTMTMMMMIFQLLLLVLLDVDIRSFDWVLSVLREHLFNDCAALNKIESEETNLVNHLPTIYRISTSKLWISDIINMICFVMIPSSNIKLLCPFVIASCKNACNHESTQQLLRHSSQDALL